MARLTVEDTKFIENFTIGEHTDIKNIVKSLRETAMAENIGYLFGKDYKIIKEKMLEVSEQIQEFEIIEDIVTEIDKQVITTFLNYLNGESEVDDKKISEIENQIAQIEHEIRHLKSLEGPIYDEEGNVIGYISFAVEIGYLRKIIAELRQILEWIKQIYEIDKMCSTKYLEIIEKIKDLHSELSQYNADKFVLPSSEELLLKLFQKTDLTTAIDPISQQQQIDTIMGWAETLDKIKELGVAQNEDDYIQAMYDIKGLHVDMVNSGLLPQELDSLQLMVDLLLASNIVRIDVQAPGSTSGENYNIGDNATEILTFNETNMKKLEQIASMLIYMPYQDKDGKWITYDKNNTHRTTVPDKWCAAAVTYSMESAGVGLFELNHIKENYGNNPYYTENWYDAFDDLGQLHLQKDKSGFYYEPQIGDVAFFLFGNPDNRRVNHVGVVSGITIRDGEIYVEVVEGNRTDGNPTGKSESIWNVFEYPLKDDNIVGYGTISDYTSESSDGCSGGVCSLFFQAL